VKGKNWVADEERQLARSVLAVSQDPIVGNQQKAGMFWGRIFVHYDERRVAGKRGTRALESNWGIVKHDVLKYIAAYKQIKDLKKSRVTEDDIRRMAIQIEARQGVRIHV
jgi:hypothetical protein